MAGWRGSAIPSAINNVCGSNKRPHESHFIRFEQEVPMVRMIVLLDYTQQGIAKISDTLSRAEAFSKAAQKAGVSVKSQYWTSGGHDGVVVLEGPDELTVQALILKLGVEGNLRSQSLRAFDRSEMEAILAKSR
jgi:uncharacterized protein with GYD domain